ncbi:MAG: glycosyltransferase family 4 protein [Firmicutes bacterium]|nr:glycosyltransferase family 4 protein [Bacillota bacterium]
MIIAANNYNKLIPNIQTPDVLLVHMPCDMVGFIENLNIRCPRIAVLHETDIKRLNNKMADISDLINNYVGIGFRSMSIKNRFCGLTPSDIDEFIVYSGAPSLAPQKEIRNEYNKCLQILFVGKLIPRKNVHVVLRSLASVSDKLDFHFTIVGEGKEKPYLESLTQSLELNAKVSFYSAMAREDVLKKMDEVDVFVMVSSSETFGLVYIEAMSRGCITIGAKGEGIDGVIIDGENGFLVEPDNIIMLQKCIIKIANMNHRERVSMSKKAVCTAQNMSEEKVADDYLNNVKKLLAHD